MKKTINYYGGMATKNREGACFINLGEFIVKDGKLRHGCILISSSVNPRTYPFFASVNNIMTGEESKL